MTLRDEQKEFEDAEFLNKLRKEEADYMLKRLEFVRDITKVFILRWPGREIMSEKGMRVYPMGQVVGMSTKGPFR